MLQKLAVVLHHHSAAARSRDDRLGSAIEEFYPGINVAARLREGALGRIQVVTQGAAAGLLINAEERHPQAVEHARGCGIDIRRKCRLYAALQHDHAARVTRRRRGCGPHARGDAHRLRLRQQRPQPLADAQSGGEHRTARERSAQRAAHQALAGTADRPGREHLTSNVHQFSVLHAGGTGRLAGATGETAIQMRHRDLACGCALEHLLDEIDATAGAVELIAEELIGRAGRETKPAMYALADDFLRVLRGARMCMRGAEFSVHAQRSAYRRPKFRMAYGSNVFLSS